MLLLFWGFLVWHVTEGACTGKTPPTPTSETPLNRWPMILATEDGVTTITWGMMENYTAAGYVEYDYSGTYTEKVQAEMVTLKWDNWHDVPVVKVMNQYTAKLKGLSPASFICYRLTVGGEEILGGFNFTTAPSTTSSDPVTFIAWGDMGIGVEHHPWYRPDIPEALVADAMWTSYNDADFMLALGDIGYFSGKGHEYDQRLFPYFYRHWASKPLFLTPGNHDYEADMAETFLSFFPQKQDAYNASHQGRYYSFDWANVHVTALDTEWLRYDTPNSTNGMIQWFKDDLTNTTQPWKIVMMHKMPYNMDTVADDDILNYLVPIFEQFRVPVVMGGHWHNYQRFPPLVQNNVVPTSEGGVTYLITGGGGYEINGWLAQDANGTRRVEKFDPSEVLKFKKQSGAPGPDVYQPVYHYTTWTVLDNCKLTLQAIDKDLNMFDSITINQCYSAATA